MNLDKDTLIKYTVEDKNGERIQATFTIEQVEGSQPNFYEAFKNTLRDLEDFDLESSEIISREVLISSDEENI